MQALAHAATLARLAAIAAVLALAGLLGIRPAAEPSEGGVRAMGPLPACRYDDIMTTPRGYGDWSITLVDTILRVPKTYVPPNLVRVVDLDVPGRGKVRQVVARDLKAMSDAAAAADAAIGIQSAYRSYEDQKAVFAHWVDIYGRSRALELSARPGHSEHQLGLTIDVRSEPPVDTLEGSWGGTAAGKWMRNHAWEYGFIMSYPKGKKAITCYAYEPWHFRYVGRPLAAKVHASGLTLREYLWRNFTTTVVPPPTPKPTKKPAATKAPSPSPTTVPSPTLAPAPSPTTSPSSASLPATLPPETPTSTPLGAPSVPPSNAGLWERLASNPAVVAGAGIALGTVLLGVLAIVRRGRTGIGL